MGWERDITLFHVNRDWHANDKTALCITDDTVFRKRREVWLVYIMLNISTQALLALVKMFIVAGDHSPTMEVL